MKTLGLCALAALAIVSCKKNDEQAATTSFEATINQPTNGTRTEIGADNWMIWKDGDAIKVFTADGSASADFTTTDEGETMANFTGEIIGAESYLAFYPAANVNAEAGSTTVTLTLDANQIYKNGTFSTNTYPLAAKSDESDKTKFDFRSPCGLLAIPVKGTGTIGSIELTGNNGEKLAGTYTYSLADTDNPSFTPDQQATTVTLTCVGGLQLDEDNAATMVFVLPHVNFTKGFTVVLKGTGPNATELYRLETPNPKEIVPLNIFPMNEVTVKAIEVTTNDAQDVTVNSATLSGSYGEVPDGMSATEVGFYYRKATENEYTPLPVEGAATSPFTYNLQGLDEATEYKYMAYFKNGETEYTGAEKSFTTLSAFTAPTVTTGAAAATSATAATGHVTLTAAGTGPVTEIGLCWGTTENPTVNTTANNFAAAAGQEVNTVYEVAIANLEPATEYHVRGYAKVGDDYYYAESSKTFTTELPGVESFTVDFNDGILPEGWTTIDADGDGHNWVLDTECESAYGYNQSNAGFNGGHMILSGSYHKTDGALHPDNYLVSPKVTLRSGSTFSFWAGAQDYKYPAEHFGVFVSDNGTSGWTMVQEWTMEAKGASDDKGFGRDGNTRDQGRWYYFSVDLSAYAGQRYIAIRHFNCSDQFFLNVDNIRLGDPEPGTSFSQNFNNSVLPEGWTTIDADGDGYNWVLTNQTAAYGYSSPNDGHYGTVGMTSGSYHGSAGALTPDNYLVTPKVNLVQGSTFSFWACAQDKDYPAEHFGVYVSDNGTSGWTMVQEWTMTAKGASGNKGNGRDGNTREGIGNWYQYTVDLSAYAGEKYIAIRHFNCSDEFFLEVDDILLTVNR